MSIGGLNYERSIPIRSDISKFSRGTIPRYHEDKRETWLTGEQVEELFGALDAYPDQSAADAIRLLILTGAREGEVLSANWDQFDLRRGIWTKPSQPHQAEKDRAHAVERRGTSTVASHAYDPYFPSPLPSAKRSASDDSASMDASLQGSQARYTCADTRQAQEVFDNLEAGSSDPRPSRLLRTWSRVESPCTLLASC